MALVAPQRVVRAGLAPAYSAASAAGDTFPPGPTTLLHIKNASAAAITATLVTPGNVAGLAIADVDVAVPAGGERMIGPISDDLFRNSADGLGAVTWSASASVTFAVLSI